MEEITVMMSTYNGEKYLREQIASILSQKDINVNLLIRDDGSTDNTKGILKEYEKCDNVNVLYGENLGYRESFYRLTGYALEFFPRCKWFAFSDQDDIWVDDKLVRGVIKLQSESSSGIPSLYFCNLLLVDENDRAIRPSYSKQLGLRLGDMLLCGKVSGCTTVFNRNLAQLYVSKPFNSSSPHDFWIALIARYCGYITYDDYLGIHYRQHEHNVIGIMPHVTKEIVRDRHKKAWAKTDKRLNIAKDFYSSYKDDIIEENKPTIETFINYRKSLTSKLKMILSKEFVGDHIHDKYSIIRRISFSVRILFNRV